MIKKLAINGNQPFMEILNKNFKVIYIDGEINFFQKEYLTNFLHR